MQQNKSSVQLEEIMTEICLNIMVVLLLLTQLLLKHYFKGKLKWKKTESRKIETEKNTMDFIGP